MIRERFSKWDRRFVTVFLVCFSLIRVTRELGYSWEKMTNKVQAESLQGSGYVVTKEVQERLYIPSTFKVISLDGITDGIVGIPNIRPIKVRQPNGEYYDIR